MQLNTEGTLFFLNEPFERVKHPLEYVEGMDIQSINKYGSTEQKLIEKVLSELLSLLIPTEQDGGFGAQEQEEEEYIDYYRMGYSFYCTNDSEDYAQMMGGIVCPNGKGSIPTCPDGQACQCTDPDGSCENGNDEWGYLFMPFYETTQLQNGMGWEKFNSPEASCPWMILFSTCVATGECYGFNYCAQS